jgi:tetratricopeptide (TPR) repeat protein
MDREQTEKAIDALDLADPQNIFRVGIEAIRNDLVEEILPVAEKAVERYPRDSRLWQLLGLAARRLDESARAITAFSTAADLSPKDPLIAHSLARVTHEAGRMASDLYQTAINLQPQNGEILLGRAAALVAEHETEKAVGELETLLKANPLWFDGHRSLAKIRGQMNDGSAYADSVKTSLLQRPDEPGLHQLLIGTNFEMNDLTAAATNIAAARKCLPDLPWIAEWEAYCATESGNIAHADKLFDRLGSPNTVDHAHRIARHHLRAGRPDLAAEIAEAWIERDPQALLWPYLAMAWRMTGDSRWQWLEGDSRFIGVYDLSGYLGDISRIAAVLRGLHFADRQPPDQY